MLQIRNFVVFSARLLLGYRRVNQLVARLDKIRTRRKKHLLISWLATEARSPESFHGQTMLHREAQEAESRRQVSDVWNLWLDGWNNAPEIVAEIARANDALFPEVRFRRISLDDAIDLTNLEGGTVDLYRRGVVKPWGLADLLRMRLIYMHGGSWADATVLFGSEGAKLSSSSQPAFINIRPQNVLPREFDWTVITWFFKAPVGYSFLEIWSGLLEDSYKRNGQLTAFDSFLIATFIERQGMGIPTEDALPNSHLILEKSTQLIRLVTSGATFQESSQAYHAAPFHKFSYKVSDPDSRRILALISSLAG